MRAWVDWPAKAGLIVFIATSASVILGAQLAQHGVYEPAQFVPLWSAPGIALAALLIFGWRALPGAAAGFVAAFVLSDAAPLAAIAASLGGIGNALAAYVLLRYVFKIRLVGMRGIDVLAFLGIALASCAAGAALTIGIRALGAAAPGVAAPGVAISSLMASWDNPASWAMFRSLWSGSLLGVIIIAPAALVPMIGRRLVIFQRGWLEAAALALVSAVILAVTFRFWVPGLAGDLSGRAYLVLPIIVWASIRFGRVGASVTTLVIALATLGAMASARGPFLVGEGRQDAVIFLLVVAISAQMLAALRYEWNQAQERADAIDALRKAAFDTAGVGILVVGPNGIILESNPGAAALLGLHPGKLVGRRKDGIWNVEDNTGKRMIFRLVDGEGRRFAEGEAPFDRLVERGEVVYDEVVGLDVDGQVKIWLSISMRRMRRSPAHPGGPLVLSYLDVTAARRQRVVLARSEAMFRAMADSMPALMYMTDVEGARVFVNKTWLSYTGGTFEDMLGAGWQNCVNPDEVYEVLARENAAMDRRANYSDMYRFRGADGSFRWFLDAGAPRFDQDGRYIGYVGVLTDINDREELQMHRATTQKNEALIYLTGGMAHDFNNFLAIISGNLDLWLEEHRDAAPDTVMIQNAFNASIMAGELTQRLLAYARRQELDPKPLKVAEMLDRLGVMLQRALGETIELDVVSAEDVWPIHIDRGQMESAIVNLSINARDAMPRGGRLIIEARNVTLKPGDPNGETPAAGEFVRITVADTGVGMSEEVRRRAFEPFFTTKETGKGSGLGLSMVAGFIEQSGGHVVLNSEPGKGTTVRLYLPRYLGEPVTELLAPAKRARAHRPLVLLVEDNEDLRAVATRMTINLGYEVLAVSDGSSALDVLDDVETIEIVLADVVLPGGMTGRELVAEAVSRRPLLAAVYMTGYAADVLKDPSAIDRRAPVLRKPFTRKDLEAALEEALRRRDEAA